MSLRGKDNAAPTVRARKSLRPAISNDKVVMANKVSAKVIPGSRCMEVKNPTSARCWICTPLGLPVEPDVYNT